MEVKDLVFFLNLNSFNVFMQLNQVLKFLSKKQRKNL